MQENIGGVKFWCIATAKANGEENFGRSNGRSSVASLYFISMSREKIASFKIHQNFSPPNFSCIWYITVCDSVIFTVAQPSRRDTHEVLLQAV